MIEGHILKFIQKEQSPTRRSKQFKPQQTFGCCKQSPDWFKKQFSLQPKGGYEYKYDAPNYREKFQYQSQRSKFNINHEGKSNNQQYKTIHSIHNRKKGLLSEYLDNNAWMKQTIPLTGFERGEQSRRLNNKDREKSIQAVKIKKSTYITSKTASNFYNSKNLDMGSTIKSRQIKTSQNKQFAKKQENPQNPTQFPERQVTESNHSKNSKSITLLMGQKQKIRSERNKIAIDKIHKFQRMSLEETLTARKFKSIDSQFVERRMALTARQWAGKKISPHKSIQVFDRMIGEQTFRSNKSKNTKYAMFSKKMSAPIIQDLEYSIENNKFISNQI